MHTRQEIIKASQKFMKASREASEKRAKIFTKRASQTGDGRKERPRMKALRVISAFCLGGGRDVYEGDILRVGRDINPKRAEELVANELCIEVERPKENPRESTEDKKGQSGKDPGKGQTDPGK